jgi:hypothetical protein
MRFATLVAGLLIAGTMARAADEGKAWKVLWYPWDEEHTTWDWKIDGPAMTIQDENTIAFPESVQNWELAVCSVTHPGKRLLVPLPNPLSINADGSRFMDLDAWTPGRFPVGKLDALGNGTFLCAVIGDGHRYSNVARATINRNYAPVPVPGITVAGISFPGDAIHEIALRVVPSAQDKLYSTDIYFPFVCVDGTWSVERVGAWSGRVVALKPGEPQLEIIRLDFWLPAVTPFKKARVQVKIVEDYAHNFMLRQRFALPADDPPKESATVKGWCDLFKGPLSPVFTLKADDSDTVKFEHVFGME